MGFTFGLKRGSLKRGEVGRDGDKLGGVWRIDRPMLRPETSTSIGIGDSGWDERYRYY